MTARRPESGVEELFCKGLRKIDRPRITGIHHCHQAVDSRVGSEAKRQGMQRK